MTVVSKEGLVEDTRAKFQARLDELAPAIQEAREIEDILSALSGEAPRRRGSSATRVSRGSRPQEFLSLVKESPGITISEAAGKMQSQPNYLYRIAGDLVKEGTIIKQDKGFHPVPSAPAEA